MVYMDKEFGSSESSLTIDDPIFTPQLSESGVSYGEPSQRRISIPWPGNTYMVVEKATGRVLTLHNGEPILMELGTKGQKAMQPAHYTWLCCERNNYWGFQSTATGKYFGHDGWRGGMRVSATILNCWEMFQARQLPGGGYQLLMPHHASTLYMIAIAEDGHHLARRMDGGAVWEFWQI